MNMNAQIDKQDMESRGGLISPEECAEYNAWLDEIETLNEIDNDHAEWLAENWRLEQYANIL